MRLNPFGVHRAPDDPDRYERWRRGEQQNGPNHAQQGQHGQPRPGLLDQIARREQGQVATEMDQHVQGQRGHQRCQCAGHGAVSPAVAAVDHAGLGVDGELQATSSARDPDHDHDERDQ